MTNTASDPHEIRPGMTLRHYKGGLYRVCGLCRIEATGETGVLYQPCQGDQEVIWMRPLAEFSDGVHTPGGVVKRFTVVTS